MADNEDPVFFCPYEEGNPQRHIWNWYRRLAQLVAHEKWPTEIESASIVPSSESVSAIKQLWPKFGPLFVDIARLVRSAKGSHMKAIRSADPRDVQRYHESVEELTHQIRRVNEAIDWHLGGEGISDSRAS